MHLQPLGSHKWIVARDNGDAPHIHTHARTRTPTRHTHTRMVRRSTEQQTLPPSVHVLLRAKASARNESEYRSRLVAANSHCQ
jgi:hypothetical protein